MCNSYMESYTFTSSLAARIGDAMIQWSPWNWMIFSEIFSITQNPPLLYYSLCHRAETNILYLSRDLLLNMCNVHICFQHLTDASFVHVQTSTPWVPMTKQTSPAWESPMVISEGEKDIRRLPCKLCANILLMVLGQPAELAKCEAPGV